MPGFYPHEDMDSDEDDYLLDTLNDNYSGRYVIDINYNRPLKNFPQTLNKIDEVDETCLKSPEGANQFNSNHRKHQDENGNKVDEKRRAVAWDVGKDLVPISRPNGRKERPKSASSAAEEMKKEQFEKRPRSSCAAYPSKIPVKKKQSSKQKTRSDSECSSGLSVEEGLEEEGERRRQRGHRSGPDELSHNYADCQPFVSFHHNYPLRPKSACSVRRDDFSTVKYHSSNVRSNSQPNIAQEESPPAPWSTWCEVSRFKRSLKLLGLSNSDFGLPDSPKKHTVPPRPRSSAGRSPTFSTRVLQRSISLDCLKEVVRESACSPCTGLPQRRLLAQAAYEEWYFKKCEETIQKAEAERIKSEKIKEAMEIEEKNRKAKASEQYLKWMEKKKIDSAIQANKKPKVNPKLENRLMKSRDEIDKAYLEWKRKKKHDSGNKKKQEEQEKAEAEKARKEEKQRQAEKVFKEWKKKMEETERLKKARENQLKEKMKNQLTSRSKSSTGYTAWKEQKDGEMKMRAKKQKEAARKADDVRSMTLSERQYEAEQAFDEWLEKVDSRRLTDAAKKSGPRNIAPWTPA